MDLVTGRSPADWSLDADGKPVLLLGLGNPLLTDDGVGVILARQLATCALPTCVEVMDGGTRGLALLPYLAGRSALVLLDAARRAGRAGDLTWLRWPRDLRLQHRTSLSPHEGSALELVELAALTGVLPETVWVGAITPAVVQTGSGLSPALAGALARLVQEVLGFVRRLVQEMGWEP